jgi:hypothetical protein
MIHKSNQANQFGNFMRLDYSDQQKGWQVIRKHEGSDMFLALISLNLFRKLQLKEKNKEENTQ